MGEVIFPHPNGLFFGVPLSETLIPCGFSKIAWNIFFLAVFARPTYDQPKKPLFKRRKRG
jgi:hypothetical protein